MNSGPDADESKEEKVVAITARQIVENIRITAESSLGEKDKLVTALEELEKMCEKLDGDSIEAENLKATILSNFKQHCEPEMKRALSASVQHNNNDIKRYTEAIQNTTALLKSTLQGLSVQQLKVKSSEYKIEDFTNKEGFTDLKSYDDGTIYIYKILDRQDQSIYYQVNTYDESLQLQDANGILPGSVLGHDDSERPDRIKQFIITEHGPPKYSKETKKAEFDSDLFNKYLTGITKIERTCKDSSRRKCVGGLLIIAGAIAIGHAFIPAIAATAVGAKATAALGTAAQAVGSIGVHGYTVGGLLANVGTYLSSVGSTYIGVKAVYAVGMLNSLLSQSPVLTVIGGALSIKLGQTIYPDAPEVTASKKNMAKGLRHFYEMLHGKTTELEKQDLMEKKSNPKPSSS